MRKVGMQVLSQLPDKVPDVISEISDQGVAGMLHVSEKLYAGSGLWKPGVSRWVTGGGASGFWR